MVSPGSNDMQQENERPPYKPFLLCDKDYPIPSLYYSIPERYACGRRAILGESTALQVKGPRVS